MQIFPLYAIKWQKSVVFNNFANQEYMNIISATRILILLLSTINLSSCLPIIFAGTAITTYELAKDRSYQETSSDVVLATKIKSNLFSSHFRNIYTKVNVSVVNNRVLLTGSVSSPQDILTLTKIIWSYNEVKDVIDELSIDKNSNKFDIFQYSKDSIITSQVKSKIFVNRDIKFVNYSIITQKNIVYLFGMERSEKELNIVA